MAQMIRPRWITLRKLTTDSDLDEVAFRFFGYKSAKPGQSAEKHDATQFVARMGIDLTNFMGCYVETGTADSPTGPATPATRSHPIRRVLVFKQSRRGLFTTEALTFFDGFRNDKLGLAWVDVDRYEKMLGDDFFDTIQETAKKIGV